MTKALTDATHLGAHPTMREFAELLDRWGFKPARDRRADRHHRTLRGPHGGRILVLASLQGRADADQIARAARLAHVDVEIFLAGPSSRVPTPEPATAQIVAQPSAARRDPLQSQSRPDAVTAPQGQGDSVVSIVLTTHARHDRPMNFEEIVGLCHGRVTRAQVVAASANLCRIGQLDRVHEGVYQWAHGARRPVQIVSETDAPTQPQQPATSPAMAGNATGPVDDLFARLFPHGVRMTPELLRDFQRWTELTQTLAAHADNPR